MSQDRVIFLDSILIVCIMCHMSAHSSFCVQCVIHGFVCRVCSCVTYQYYMLIIPHLSSVSCVFPMREYLGCLLPENKKIGLIPHFLIFARMITDLSSHDNNGTLFVFISYCIVLCWYIPGLRKPRDLVVFFLFSVNSALLCFMGLKQLFLVPLCRFHSITSHRTPNHANRFPLFVSRPILDIQIMLCMCVLCHPDPDGLN